MRDLLAYCIGYSAQVIGYLLLLTDRYPNSDPAVYESANVYRSDPIRLHVTDDLQRSRLTVFFRLLLAFPHFVWLLLWGIAAFFAAIANWFVTLFRGRPPQPLHRFLAALRALPDPRLRVPAAGGEPVPGLQREAGHAIRSRWRSILRSARTAG